MLLWALLVAAAGPPVSLVEGKTLDRWVAVAFANVDDGRSEAVWAIACFNTQAARVVPALGRLLGRSDGASAMRILQLFADLGRDAGAAAPAVLRKIRRGSIREAEYAVHVFGRVATGADAAHALIMEFKDDSHSSIFRERLLLAVVAIAPRDVSVKRLIEEAVTHEMIGVRINAARAALRAGMDLRGRDAVIRNALKAEGYYRCLLVELLGEMLARGEDALPTLKRLLDDPETYVRKDAFAAICQHAPPTPETMRLAERLLADKDWYIRTMAAKELARYGPGAKGLVPKLRAATGDTDPFVRSAAAVTLWKMSRTHERLAVETLIGCLEAESNHARVNAANLLGEMGTAAKPAIPALKRRLSDSWDDVQEAARAALEKIARMVTGDRRPAR